MDIHMPIYDIRKVKWCSAYAVADLTYRDPRPAAELGAFIFRVSKLLLKWQQWCYSRHFKIVTNVMASVSKAECAYLFIKSR